jgi:anti-anti-sigma factor
MPEPVKLIILEGDPEGEHPAEVAMRGDAFLIGRSAASNLAIEHSRISMEHCRLERRGDGIWLTDLKSTFGTQVNGATVTECPLRDGDLLQVGPMTLLVAIGAEASDQRRRVQAHWTSERETAEMITARGGRDPNQDTPAVQTARRIFENLAGRGEGSHDRERPRQPLLGEEGEDSGDFPPLAEDDPLARTLGPGHKRRWYLRARRDENGIVVIELLDRSILHDQEISQIHHEIDQLVMKGVNRMVLNFGNVHHLSSQALGILLQFQKRCKAAGGLIKVCNPNPQVAEIFKISNLMRVVEVFADEAQALASDWPTAPAVPTGSGRVSTAPSVSGRPSLAEALEKLTLPPPVVKLVLEVGRSKGKTVAVNGPRFVIGRDPRCHLRPASEAISRVHTRIDLRDGLVFVRDMGTANGTRLGGQLLQGEEAEAHDGDRLEIGPLVFTLSIVPATIGGVPSSASGTGTSKTDAAEDAAASWLLEAGEQPKPGDTSQFPLIDTKPAPADAARARAAAEFRRLRTQVVGEVLLITIQSTELVDEEQVGPVRRELLATLEPPLPKRVVIRLERVMALSSLGVAMLLGHFQRLDRMGGSLRLSNVRDEVFPALENVIASGAVGVYPRAEQAIQDAWPIT